MTTRVSAQPEAPANRDPVYVGSTQRSEVYAHFKSGAIVRAPRSRARSYPNLRGGAPPTRAFYAELARQCRGGLCIDVGTGSAEGAELLGARADRVFALERDREALAFAREYTRRAEIVDHDARYPLPVKGASHAMLADVLGHVKDPSVVLTHVRDALAEDGRALIAEPHAAPGQRLTPPLRRAFSTRELERLLARSGFRVESWVMQHGTFVSCFASPLRTAAADALVRGVRALSIGDPEAALGAFARATDSEDRLTAREARLGRARAAVALGRGNDAVMALDAAVAIDPDCSEAYASLAEIALLMGEADNALSLAMRAAELDSTSPLAARVAAHAAGRLGHPEAPAAWRTALSLSPDHVDVAGEAARVFAERGDYANGIVVFERLRAYGDPLGAPFHTTLGWLLLLDGRTADARLEAQMALQLAPHDDAASELWTALQGDPRATH